jgi:DNA-binding GntR family transcriptional regulator
MHLGALVQESAYEALRRDIITGDIPPGEHLAELVLAERYGVSRTPIREGLRRLEQDGLVERRGRRMHVRQHRPEEILDMFEVHIVLETAAARGAALRHSALDVSLLAHAHQDALAVPEDGPVAARTHTDRLFHQRLWAASHSATLVDLLERLNVQLHRYPESTLTHPGRWPQVLADHTALLAAISEHRAEDAAVIATRHLTEAREVRLRMFAQAGRVPAP